MERNSKVCNTCGSTLSLDGSCPVDRTTNMCTRYQALAGELQTVKLALSSECAKSKALQASVDRAKPIMNNQPTRILVEDDSGRHSVLLTLLANADLSMKDVERRLDHYEARVVKWEEVL